MILKQKDVAVDVACLSLASPAECPKPERWENIVLTDRALLINEFPDDSQVTVECANGYIRESGSGTATCTGGTWSEPDLICKSESFRFSLKLH